MERKVHPSRRKFIQQSAIVGAGLMFAGPIKSLVQTDNKEVMCKNIASKGYLWRA